MLAQLTRPCFCSLAPGMMAGLDSESLDSTRAGSIQQHDEKQWCAVMAYNGATLAELLRP